MAAKASARPLAATVPRKQAVVAGGGPAGLLSAILLGSCGYSAKVYEREGQPDPDEEASSSASTILALTPRDQAALLKAGVQLPAQGRGWFNSLAKGAQPASDHCYGGALPIHWSSLIPDCIFVERQTLVDHLHLEAERLHGNSIQVHQGCKLVDVDLKNRRAWITRSKPSTIFDVGFSLLVGADGMHSTVRQLLQAHDPSLACEEVGSRMAYQAFARLPPEGLDREQDASASGVCLYAGSEMDHSIVTWMSRVGTVSGLFQAPSAFFNGEDGSSAQRKSRTEYEAHLRRCFPTAPQAWLPLMADQLRDAPLSRSGASLKCSKLHGPSTVLLGDAGHSVLPALGQGCTAALEDCVIFAQILQECKHDVARSVEMYSHQRLPEVQALFDLDVNLDNRSGRNGIWRPSFLAASFHLQLWNSLSKVFPQIKGPEYSRMLTGVCSYQEAAKALKRDSYILVTLLIAVAACAAQLLYTALCCA